MKKLQAQSVFPVLRLAKKLRFVCIT
jgi:hypothetical protein